jgi:cytochrome c peroxidase
VAQALSDFIEAMPSFSSKYDTSQGNLTQQEQLGRSLFNTHCATCHTVGTGAFTNGLFMNNGLDLHYSDTGRAQITHNPQDEGKFRVPSLRDVAVTAPYMHDGRFQTLRQVIDFYSNGVSANPYLSAPLTPAPKNFTESEKLALEAFLKTLTDETAATNPAFSDPFRKD